MDIVIPRSSVNPGQWDFLRADDPVTLLSGGFGAGKTTALALKILQLKFANPKTPGLVMSPNWRSLWSTLYRTIRKVSRRSLPQKFWPRVIDKQGECYLDFGDGVPVFMRSARNIDSFDGLDVGWGAGDEIRHWHRASYDVFRGRIRVRCPLPQAAFSSTPQMNWMAMEFNSGIPSHRLISAPTVENIKNLQPNYIDELRASYGRRLQQAYIDGQFTVLEGAVFDVFDSNSGDAANPWFIDYDAKKNLHRKTYLAIDPGYRHSAWIWIHELAETEWVVIDQMMPDNMSTAMAVRMANERGWPIDEIWVDPAADATQEALAIDDLQVIRMLRSRGGGDVGEHIRAIVNPWRSIEYGIEKIRFLLGDPSINLTPRIKFSKKLAHDEIGSQRGIVKDLAALRYQETRDSRTASSKPIKDGITDHSTDALRMWSVGMFLTSSLRQHELDNFFVPGNRQGWRIAA